MKPRIYWWRNVWNCMTREAGRVCIGCGWTPKEAYLDWKAQCE